MAPSRGPPSLERVHALWVEPAGGGGRGPAARELAPLSAASFVRLGHPYTLWAPGGAAGLPEELHLQGVEVRDADAVLQGAEEWARAGSPAGFADAFRYAVLHAEGGWWADLDVVAVRELAAGGDDEVVLAGQRSPPRHRANNNVLRAPRGHALFAELRDRALALGPGAPFGTHGPGLLTRVVDGDPSLERLVAPWAAYNPYNWDEVLALIDPGEAAAARAAAVLSDPATRAVHLWASRWDALGVSPQVAPTLPACALARLRAHVACGAARPRS